jgi:hypothetical protein
MSKFEYLKVEYQLDEEQSARLTALTELHNRLGGHKGLSREDVFSGIMFIGSSHVINDRLAHWEQALAREEEATHEQ